MMNEPEGLNTYALRFANRKHSRVNAALDHGFAAAAKRPVGARCQKLRWEERGVRSLEARSIFNVLRTARTPSCANSVKRPAIAKLFSTSLRRISIISGFWRSGR